MRFTGTHEAAGCKVRLSMREEVFHPQRFSEPFLVPGFIDTGIRKQSRSRLFPKSDSGPQLRFPMFQSVGSENATHIIHGTRRLRTVNTREDAVT